jgi:hypothetical protein
MTAAASRKKSTVAETDTKQSTGQATGNAFSETGHKAATDVNTEESISTYNGLAVQAAIKHAATMDNLSTQILQNAIESANLVSKQAIRHTDIAIDREWNIDEQSVAVAALYARLIERLNNPTPLTED